MFPNTVTTLADQVTSAGQTWKAYAQDMEKGPKGAILCRRPPSNGLDDTQQPRPGDTYAARNNPFVYFHSLLDLSDCDANAGPLTKLEGDLASAKKTPNVSYIAPGLCSDGSVTACADGTPAGLAAADAFLKTWVPKIFASPAYKEDGLLVITFAGGAGAPAGADGPVRNGTLLISRYAKPGGVDETELDPYALLRTFEDLLGYKALARAKTAPSLTPTVLATARVIEPGDD
ncbi:alkaline phosphatase family protein [Svornostia abyssi]|uniref:Alkaline phosphatase family protein n=1 Tax=Svornostia abyssi TaxID=2898438 RepID=A0ABY5PL01_9ACTN|nr:alkaline phosphatase family protein [Parviterribacteraceae bacterium J379]